MGDEGLEEGSERDEDEVSFWPFSFLFISLWFCFDLSVFSWVIVYEGEETVSYGGILI